METENSHTLIHTIKTAEGREIIIREAVEADAEGILDFGRELFANTDQVLTMLHEFNYTVEQEREMIYDHAMRKDALLLVAAHGNKIVGLMNFSCHKKTKMSHSGEMGVSVRPGYQQNGIGRAMLRLLLIWAETVDMVEKIILNVFHTNLHGIRLYQSLGFKPEGRQVRAIRQPDGSYADMITMSYFK
jgi:RimJ/RimL family protein N-acetyltransferase